MKKLHLIETLSILTLSLSLTACGGDGGGEKTFQSLNSIQGTYYPTDVLCDGDEDLNQNLENEALRRVDKDGGTLWISPSQIMSRFQSGGFQCEFVIKSNIQSATSSKFVWSGLSLNFEGPQCAQVPQELKNQAVESMGSHGRSGSVNFRSTNKILMLSYVEDGGCDVFVRK